MTEWVRRGRQWRTFKDVEEVVWSVTFRPSSLGQTGDEMMGGREGITVPGGLFRDIDCRLPPGNDGLLILTVSEWQSVCLLMCMCVCACDGMFTAL